MTRKPNKSVAVGGVPPPPLVVGMGEEGSEVELGENEDNDMAWSRCHRWRRFVWPSYDG
jgi:hypothetical protein